MRASGSEPGLAQVQKVSRKPCFPTASVPFLRQLQEQTLARKKPSSPWSFHPWNCGTEPITQSSVTVRVGGGGGPALKVNTGQVTPTPRQLVRDVVRMTPRAAGQPFSQAQTVQSYRIN